MATLLIACGEQLAAAPEEVPAPCTTEAAFGPEIASNNLRITTPSGCAGEATARCRSEGCTSGTTCTGSFLEPWDATGGVTELAAKGYRLKPTLCFVGQGAVTVDPPVTVDHFGAARTEKLSIGAHEQDAACMP